ncbi:MAG: putative baseplate assembly protein [Hormoscilla sp. GM7CHS1pb]|nr:putative baseplate assembly protein [Hormoscilla sp. GM7CHS1pb]
MSDEYIVTDSQFRHQRRVALSHHPSQIGLDYIKVEWVGNDKWDLWVYFVPAAQGTIKQVAPATVTAGNISITKGGSVSRDVELISPGPEGEVNTEGNLLKIEVKHQLKSGDSEEQSNSYTLELISIDKVDRFFKELSFGFRKPDQITTKVDPQQQPPGELQVREPIEITYLAKDYSSFRQVILDRLSVVMPEWIERNPSDIGIMLTEILAYAADNASYYQDAVATEAYLSMARQRISIRRHCRLVDYALHEGCNARVWVYIEFSSEQPEVLEKGAKLVTGASSTLPVLDPKSRDAAEVLGKKGAKIFETLHDRELRSEHNQIEFYAWGASELYLEKGATKATLKGRFAHLQPGDVLLLEEVQNPETGEAGNPDRRQVVRLISVDPNQEDPLAGRFKNPPDYTAQQLTEIEWDIQDALTFPLCVAKAMCGETSEPISVARGNIILADHGESQPEEELPEVPASGDYRPQLQESDLTYGEVYNHEQAKASSAAEMMQQDPQAAVPLLELRSYSSTSEDWETWHVRPDLLNSDQFATDFVVEMDNDRIANLRFGDGDLGKVPSVGMKMLANYRRGNGAAGNVGREAIAYLLPKDGSRYSELVGKIPLVSNPLAAQGGIDPEPIADARLNAPQAFRIRQSCVTEADYVEVMERHPEVQRAAAQLRWTGSWYTVFIAVDRYGGTPLDDDFKEELGDYIMPFRLMAHDLEIVEPTFVPLDSLLLVEIKDGYFQRSIFRELENTFSNQDLPDGKRGFFHPDNLSFGQPVYLSQIIQRAMEIAGVYRVEAKRFQVWGRTPLGELDAGIITTEALSIVQVDNNPYTPENGLLEFELEGGI